MNIEDIMEAMDDLLDKSLGVPLSGGKCIVDADKLRDFINDIRLNLPSEVKQARMIVADRKTILSDAKKEADQIIKRAEDKSKLMVANEEIVKQAQARAAEIMSQAQGRAKELRYATNEYIENMLTQVEDVFTKDINDIRRTKQALKATK